MLVFQVPFAGIDTSAGADLPVTISNTTGVQPGDAITSAVLIVGNGSFPAGEDLVGTFSSPATQLSGGASVYIMQRGGINLSGATVLATVQRGD